MPCCADIASGAEMSLGYYYFIIIVIIASAPRCHWIWPRYKSERDSQYAVLEVIFATQVSPPKKNHTHKPPAADGV